MNTKKEEGGLHQVLRETDELLNKLDGIQDKTRTSDLEGIHEPKQELRKKWEIYDDEVNTQESQPIIVLGLILILGILVLIIQVASQANKTGSRGSSGDQREQTRTIQDTNQYETSKPITEPTTSNQEQVYFTGIDLPVTNTLCNKKGNFCIYGLARLVQTESGSANYTFEDVANGENVSIHGDIEISNIDKGSDGTRTFTFSFRDNQSETTPGWAAAGYFNIEKNAKQPGIMTRFKTTESFGPKTPVGLENTSFLFPRS